MKIYIQSAAMKYIQSVAIIIKYIISAHHKFRARALMSFLVPSSLHESAGAEQFLVCTIHSGAVSCFALYDVRQPQSPSTLTVVGSSQLRTPATAAWFFAKRGAA